MNTHKIKHNLKIFAYFNIAEMLRKFEDKIYLR